MPPKNTNGFIDMTFDLVFRYFLRIRRSLKSIKFLEKINREFVFSNTVHLFKRQKKLIKTALK